MVFEQSLRADRSTVGTGGSSFFSPASLTSYKQAGPARPARCLPAPSGVISRTDFDRHLLECFGISDVRTGTLADQQASLTLNGRIPDLPDWQSWDPGTSSSGYSDIIQAFEDMYNSFGGLPTVRTVVFYRMDYSVSREGVATPRPMVGASFGAGVLAIYEQFTGNHPVFPTARSEERNGVQGAPLAQLPSAQHTQYNMVHELGHAAAEDAMRRNPEFFRDFKCAVGWVNDQRLYDIGRADVVTAIANGQTPPDAFLITPAQWNNPRWTEQPMSSYAVTGGPVEDFSEAVTAYVYARHVLQSRSPARYRIIEEGIRNGLFVLSPATGGRP